MDIIKIWAMSNVQIYSRSSPAAWKPGKMIS